MNASMLLAVAESRGLVLLPVGDKLRVLGPLPTELAPQLIAAKTEVLRVLRAREAHRLWSAVYHRLTGVWPGRDVVGALDSGLLHDFDAAEAAAEDLSDEFLQGRVSIADVAAALQKWEILAWSAFGNATRICDICGGTPTIATFLGTGKRCCARCCDNRHTPPASPVDRQPEDDGRDPGQHEGGVGHG